MTKYRMLKNLGLEMCFCLVYVSPLRPSHLLIWAMSSICYGYPNYFLRWYPYQPSCPLKDKVFVNCNFHYCYLCPFTKAQVLHNLSAGAQIIQGFLDNYLRKSFSFSISSPKRIIKYNTQMWLWPKVSILTILLEICWW